MHVLDRYKQNYRLSENKAQQNGAIFISVDNYVKLLLVFFNQIENFISQKIFRKFFTRKGFSYKKLNQDIFFKN